MWIKIFCSFLKSYLDKYVKSMFREGKEEVSLSLLTDKQKVGYCCFRNTKSYEKLL